MRVDRIADRISEHTSYSDRGVVMYREMLLENIEKVQQGLEPLGVVRDPDHPIIDTNLKQELEGSRRGRLSRRPVEAQTLRGEVRKRRRRRQSSADERCGVTPAGQVKGCALAGRMRSAW